MAINKRFGIDCCPHSYSCCRFEEAIGLKSLRHFDLTSKILFFQGVASKYGIQKEGSSKSHNPWGQRVSNGHVLLIS